MKGVLANFKFANNRLIEFIVQFLYDYEAPIFEQICAVRVISCSVVLQFVC